MSMTFSMALWGDKKATEHTVAFKEWTQAILDLCQKENMEPDFPSMKLMNGKPSKIKMPTFRKRLLKIKNLDINWLSLTKSKPNFHYLYKDWEFSSSIESKQWLNSIYVGFDIEKLSQLYKEKFEILSNMLTYFTIDYGFCFHLESKYSPGIYVFGMLDTTFDNIIEKFDSESTALWSNYQPEAMHAVKNGKLRYLYEYNIINASHLKRQVYGNTLEQWISCSSEKGTLRPLNDRLYLWSVEPSRLSSLIHLLMDQNIFLLDKNMKPNFE
jgi:hypothetical protein